VWDGEIFCVLTHSTSFSILLVENLNLNIVKPNLSNEQSNLVNF